jgi:uncharacterized protein YfaT (DUF1175 family)
MIELCQLSSEVALYKAWMVADCEGFVRFRARGFGVV